MGRRFSHVRIVCTDDEAKTWVTNHRLPCLRNRRGKVVYVDADVEVPSAFSIIETLGDGPIRVVKRRKGKRPCTMATIWCGPTFAEQMRRNK